MLLASSGIGLLILFARKAARLGSQPQFTAGGFLVLWFPTTVVFFLVFAEMMSARYLLLGLPPLFLIVFDRLQPKVAAFMATAGMILSLSLAVADYRFVNAYRAWVEQDIVPLQQQGFRLWNASESGLRFYLERKGIETLDNQDTRPRGTDLVIRQTSFQYGLSKDLGPVLVDVFQDELPDSYPIRTFSREAGAAFHDSHFGIVPFTISRAPLDRLEIGQVSPFVTDLPQVIPADFSSVPVWFSGGVLLKQVEPEMRFRIRIPSETRFEYELEGAGSLELSEEGVILKKESSGPVIWKNFRMIPEKWPIYEQQ
jgi:hypothetical protein